MGRRLYQALRIPGEAALSARYGRGWPARAGSATAEGTP